MASHPHGEGAGSVSAGVGIHRRGGRSSTSPGCIHNVATDSTVSAACHTRPVSSWATAVNRPDRSHVPVKDPLRAVYSLNDGGEWARFWCPDRRVGRRRSEWRFVHSEPGDPRQLGRVPRYAIGDPCLEKFPATLLDSARVRTAELGPLPGNRPVGEASSPTHRPVWLTPYSACSGVKPIRQH